MADPKRIQRSRAKGWRMPAGAVYVGRPTRWGNPFTAKGCRDAGYHGTGAEIAERCVGAFRAWLGPYWRENWDGEESAASRAALLGTLDYLRGKDLACWCRLDRACHADVLLLISNMPICEAIDAEQD